MPAGPRHDVLVGIAHELAEAVVGPLRRRLAADDGGLDEAEESVVVEHVGSAFREWKGERIERLAGDHVVAAFSAGTMAAVDGGAQQGKLRVGGRRRLGGRPLPRLRGQRAQRIPAARRGVPNRPSASAGPPRVSMPLGSLRHLGCSRASPERHASDRRARSLARRRGWIIAGVVVLVILIASLAYLRRLLHRRPVVLLGHRCTRSGSSCSRSRPGCW